MAVSDGNPTAGDGTVSPTVDSTAPYSGTTVLSIQQPSVAFFDLDLPDQRNINDVSSPSEGFFDLDMMINCTWEGLDVSN
jgi:hypothetical protein